MKLPLHIAQQLLQLLLPNSSLPASAMKHNTVTKMLQDGMLQKQQISNSKAIIFIAQKKDLAAYLHNHFGITNLQDYVNHFADENISRATATSIASNSKLKNIRSFKGFLVTCYQPVEAILNGKKIILHPAEGSYIFISDHENFTVAENITIVGIENAENFSQIKKQQYLFKHITPLFVCRYPQSNDLVKWLQSISNPYLHFGDLDFAGITIYLSAYKKHLGNKAAFFLPANTETLLQKFGNKALFNKQYNSNLAAVANTEAAIVQLTQLLLKFKMVLEQEIFIID
ncbi:DUF7281 domain-containing protein [Ferruginibacter sp.]|nr:hypothetical protein [Ferruginibacter sp.]